MDKTKTTRLVDIKMIDYILQLLNSIISFYFRIPEWDKFGHRHPYNDRE
jgi:hypothetical protein